MAYVVPRLNHVLDAVDLRRGLQQTLPAYMLPAAFVPLAALPLTSNGKRDRQALPAPDQTHRASGERFAAPRTPIEELLAAIWADVLGIEPIGAHDDFFALGGHSLLAARVLVRLREAFHIELPLRVFFDAPTLAGLARRVEAARQTGRVAPPSLVAGPRYGAHPLSFAQESLWFFAQYHPASPAYNLPLVLHLAGILDVAALARGLDTLVRRHDTLRAAFTMVDGQPRQIITPAPSAPELAIAFPLIDLHDLGALEREAETRRLIDDEARRLFDLTHGPLLRATLLRLTFHDHLLLLTLHHIATDGWSRSVLARELDILYAAFANGGPSPLPDLPIQYADYARWQRAYLQGEALETRLAYWRGQLAGAPTVLELPADGPRPSVQSFSGAAQTLRLPDALTHELRSLSQRDGVTLFMTLLAAFQVLLGRYTAQEDVLIGAPIAGRSLLEADGLIGFFVNTLVLRGDLSGDPSFHDLLRRVRAVTLDAFAHADLPFEQLVQDLHPPRDPSRAPLVQILFNMLNVPRDEFTLAGLTVDMASPPEGQAKFDLTLYVEEQRGGLELRVVYNTALFARERMVELARQYQHLLAQVAQRPDAPISHISLVTPAMAPRLPRPADVLPRASEETIQAPFVRQARRHPHRAAVVDTQGVWSYGELDAWSNRLARCLHAHDIGPGSIVALYGHRDASLVGALLGILRAGAAFLILDPAYPVTQLIARAQAARPRGWIYLDAAGSPPTALRAFVAASSVRCQLTLPHGDARTNGLTDYSTDDLAVVVGPDDAAYVAFTSGSTGQPKGVVGRHGPVSHFLRWHSATFELDESDRFSLLAGLSYDALLRDIFMPLWLGAPLYIPALNEGAYDGLAAWMRENSISVAHLTPALARLFSTDEASHTADDSAVRSLRWLFLGGDVVTERDVSRLRALAPLARCVNFYGTTETPQAVGYFIVPAVAGGERPPPEMEEAPERQSVPLGRGIDDVQLLVLTPARRLAGVGEIGEIYVRTPYLSQGYLGDDALTAERFIVNPFTQASDDLLYRTGDLGRYRPDGQIVFLGRRDHQVKIRGFRIEPGEVEATLRTHPAVSDAAVLAREEAPGDTRLVAYVAPRPGSAPGYNTLRAFVATKLPSYMVPAAYVTLDALPRTPTNKVDLRALPAPPPTRPDLATPFVPPRTPLEETLAALWASLLGVEQVGVDDDFFILGGHSLLAMRMVARVRDALGVDVPLRRVFEEPTVARLAVAVAETERIDAPDPAHGTAAALSAHAAADLLANLDALSETEIDALLDRLREEGPEA